MTNKTNRIKEFISQSITDNESPKDASRRNLLLGLGAILGTATVYKLVGPDSVTDAVTVALDYTPSPTTTLQAGKVLSKNSLLTLHDICALVIPATDTPGAADVDVHGFIDHQLFACHSEQEQTQVTRVIAKIEKESLQLNQTTFTQSSGSQKLSLLTNLEQAQKGFNQQDKNAFKFLKGLIVFGYYTSEVGASQELTYLAVPGGYTPSIPSNSVRTSFAPTDFY